MKKFLLSLFACFLVVGVTVQDAEAKRLGGGRSTGMQREATPPSAPRQATPQQAAPQNPAAAPQAGAAQPKRNWLGPIAGLAAGLGIAALLSHFGLGEGVATFLMMALIAMAVFFVIRMVMRKAKPQPAQEPMQYAGVGGPNIGRTPHAEEPLGGVQLDRGNAVPGSLAAVTAGPATAPRVPADFDSEGFLRVAKVNFVRLQAANDAGNIEDIREFTSPEMFAEIKLDMDERKGAQQRTDVVTLEAELLEVTTEGDRHIASVRFHGMLREENEGAATPFDEVWHLTKPTSGTRGWMLAGIQQLN